MTNYKIELYGIAQALGVGEITAPVLCDSRFLTCSGSHVSRGHHYGTGGLLRHTWEVCSIALQMASFYRDRHNIGRRELFLSALFHDYGKIWDYTYDESTKEWKTNDETKHKRRIHHIQRSAIEWEVVARELNLDPEFTERVTHNILSHHGQRQWGSPVAPLTREAWILHLADGLSARVDDCDRLDLALIDLTK